MQNEEQRPKQMNEIINYQTIIFIAYCRWVYKMDRRTLQSLIRQHMCHQMHHALCSAGEWGPTTWGRRLDLAVARVNVSSATGPYTIDGSGPCWTAPCLHYCPRLQVYGYVRSSLSARINRSKNNIFSLITNQLYKSAGTKISSPEQSCKWWSRRV